MHLTKIEQETIINFNQEEEIAYIYTCNKQWIRYLEDKLGVKPTKKCGGYAKEFECPKAWIRKPRKPRQLSEKQKQKLIERIIQASNLSGKKPYALVKNGERRD